jgi:hypothetical protein
LGEHQPESPKSNNDKNAISMPVPDEKHSSMKPHPEEWKIMEWRL